MLRGGVQPALPLGRGQEWKISIPMLRGGVQPEFLEDTQMRLEISIPMLRGGVQAKTDFRNCYPLYFNSHATWGSSTANLQQRLSFLQISIPMLRGGVQR